MKLFTDEQIKNGEADDYEPVILAPEEGVSYRVTSDNFEELLLKSAEQAVEHTRLNSELENIVARTLTSVSEQLAEACCEDLVEILRQMILSGDIVKYTTTPRWGNDTVFSKQKLVYLPYQGQDALKRRIEELEEVVRKLSKPLITKTTSVDPEYEIEY